jgi:hypothetical protein
LPKQCEQTAIDSFCPLRICACSIIREFILRKGFECKKKKENHLKTNVREYRRPKGQSKIDNPEKPATHGTQDKSKQNKHTPQHVLYTNTCKQNKNMPQHVLYTNTCKQKHATTCAVHQYMQTKQKHATTGVVH